MEENQSSDVSGLGIGDLIDTNNNNTETPEQIAAKAKAASDEAAKKLADDAAKKIADEVAAKKIEDDKKAAGQGDQNKTPEAVEIEGIKYKLDDKGNALDDKGQVFKTKDELDQLEEGDLPPLPVEIIQKMGYEILDEKGKPKQYEDTVEGAIEAVKDIASKMNEKFRTEFLESDPELKEFVEYKARGGKLEDFVQKKTSSWKSVKLDENNEAQLESVVMADLLASGMDKVQADMTIGLYKDSKKLKDFGKSAYQRLVAHEDAIETQEKQEFEESRKTYIKQQEDHWKSVKTITDTGNLKGIVIPDSEREAFYKYIAIAVDDKGNSQRNLDRSKLPLEQLLQLDYYQFKGFDVSKLIKDAANTTRVRSLRDRINKSQTSGLGDGQGADRTKIGKPDDLNITVEDLTG